MIGTSYSRVVQAETTLICQCRAGDPLQLRATINNYGKFRVAFYLFVLLTFKIIALSSDNPRTGRLYAFDVSLQERLSKQGLKVSNPASSCPAVQLIHDQMSTLNVQRRMRPEISQLVRQVLAKRLRDDRTMCAEHVASSIG